MSSSSLPLAFTLVVRPPPLLALRTNFIGDLEVRRPGEKAHDFLLTLPTGHLAHVEDFVVAHAHFPFGPRGSTVSGRHITYWITSSARRSNDGGIVSPRTFAVLRLMTSSNFVGCSTGRSPGFAPFRILST
jgi:hypothetical protein